MSIKKLSQEHLCSKNGVIGYQYNSIVYSDIPETTLRSAQIVSYMIALVVVILAVFHLFKKVLMFILLFAKKHAFSVISLDIVPTPKLSLLKVGPSHIYFNWKRPKSGRSAYILALYVP